MLGPVAGAGQMKARKSEFVPGAAEPCVCGSGLRFRKCCGSTAADRPPPRGVGIQPGFLDPLTCRAWITYLHGQPRLPLGTVQKPEHGISHFETTRLLAARITDIVKPGRLRRPIERQIQRAYQEVIAPVCGRLFAWFEDPQVLRYQRGGWYRAHADSELLLPDGERWVRGIDRDMSLLLYLNDDFRGGGLSFVFFGYTYRPRAGDLVFFPSDHRYAHQAQPVARGVRWAVVSWAAFTGEPRVRKDPPPASILLG